MKKLKVAVCMAFVISFGAFALLRSDPVTGQTGGTSLAAPTGVIASDGKYNNKVSIYWDTIRDATLYRVFRNTANDSGTAIDIGTTATNSLFDTTATQGQAYFYWVRAENDSTQSDLSVADQGTRANGNQQGPLPPLGPPPPAPTGNPVTAAKAYLGKTLFWDEQMSSTRTVACGTCHHSGTGGADPRSALSPTNSTNPGPDGLFGTADDIRGSGGVPENNPDGSYVFSQTYGFHNQVTGRKSPSFVNAAYFPILFWDGRASGTYLDPLTNNVVLNGGAALESQASGPPVATVEMGHDGRDWTNVASRIETSRPLALSPSIPPAMAAWINGRSYADLFNEAYGSPDVTPTRISMAIATYERTLYSDQTPVDLDAAGITPLTGAAARGRGVFTNPNNNCTVCHAGPTFSDNTFRYIGVRPTNDDTGRFQQTGQNQDLGAFRVPSLRNVGLRGTYFHNGQFTTLAQVVAFYDRGGDFSAPNKPNNLIHPLGLSAGAQSDLVAFLNALTDPRVAAENAMFDRPTLYTESTRIPQITGTGRAGSGGVTPQIAAISPPVAGNPNFTVSVSGALGNARATLVIASTDPGLGTRASRDINSVRSFPQFVATTQNTGAGNGVASVSIAIPENYWFLGNTFYARWYVEDPGAANGIAVSQAAKFTVFGDGPWTISSE